MTATTTAAKLKRLTDHPGEVLINGSRSVLVAAIRPWLQRWSKLELERRGYLAFQTRRPANAFPADFADLWFLYRLVRKHRPKTIVEFGSGYSTVILAQALHDEATTSGDAVGELHTFEASDRWLQVTKDCMPPHLRPICHLKHAPADVVDHNGTRAFRHRGVQPIPIDMLYLDSPALTNEVNAAIDPLDLEPYFSDQFVGVIDGRPANVAYLQGHMPGYRFSTNAILRNTVFERANSAPLFNS